MLVTSFLLSFVLNNICSSNLHTIFYLLLISNILSQSQFLCKLSLNYVSISPKLNVLLFRKKITKPKVLVTSFLLSSVLNNLCSSNLHTILYLLIISNIPSQPQFLCKLSLKLGINFPKVECFAF